MATYEIEHYLTPGEHREQLYRTLSPKGNPALNSLLAILKAMGLRLAVQPLTTPAHAT